MADGKTQRGQSLIDQRRLNQERRANRNAVNRREEVIASRSSHARLRLRRDHRPRVARSLYQTMWSTLIADGLDIVSTWPMSETEVLGEACIMRRRHALVSNSRWSSRSRTGDEPPVPGG